MKAKKPAAPKQAKPAAPIKDNAPKGNPMGGVKTAGLDAIRRADP
jgi:hypothetical protein